MNKKHINVSQNKSANSKHNQTFNIGITFNKVLFAQMQVVCDMNKAVALSNRFGDRIVAMYCLSVLNRTLTIVNGTTVTAEYTVALTAQSLGTLLHAMVPNSDAIQMILYKRSSRRNESIKLNDATPDAKAAKRRGNKGIGRGRWKRNKAGGRTDRTESVEKSSSPEVTDAMIENRLKSRRGGSRRSVPHVQRKALVRSSASDKRCWLELIRRGASVGSVAVYFNVSPATVTSTLHGYRWDESVNYKSEINEAVRTQLKLGSVETYTPDQLDAIRELLDIHKWDPERWELAFGTKRHNTASANAVLRNTSKAK